MAAEAFEATVKGVVVDIEDQLARVLIGEEQEEWFFPMTTMPEGARQGSDLVFTRQRDGRYAVLGFSRTAAYTMGPSSIEDRLARPLSRFRANEASEARGSELRASDLRRALEDD